MPVLPSPKTVPSLVTICIIPIALTPQLNAGKRTTTVAEVGVSFGFDIYDSITTYLDAVKCRSEELASSLFRVRTQQVPPTAAVAECLISFEAELEALEDLVAKLAGRDAIEPKWAEKIGSKPRS
ncbi:hypothetical protein MBR_07225, partial [Metarhizium brunneum ARSEF 3297]